MSEVEQRKLNIVSQLRQLCAHCATGNNREHRCPVREISVRVNSLRGVPLIVNNEFRGVLFAKI
ncbi:MAG: hypothetical protein P4L74_02105 [Candidatus Doudnabacteria bacterium]|nr:hypothetical protein [Candidatus Doudnabacteria bacterium]